MCRCRMGNPKRSSRFICLRCLKQNCVGQGIQRPNTKEADHIKNLSCLCVHMEYKTKNLEVRYCDSFDEMMKKAKDLHREYYGKVGLMV